MKGISMTTGLEIEIGPFIIDLTSPCSTAPSTPASDIREPDIWSDFAAEKASETTAPSSPPLSSVTDCGEFNFPPETDGESLINVLSSPTEPSLTVFETLVRDPSPASRAAILYYLPLAPVVQRDISTLVYSLLRDFEIMTSLATNIGYYHARSFISNTELEYLLTQNLLCSDKEGKVFQNLNDRVLHLFNLTKRRIEQYRDMVVPQQKLNKQKYHQQMLKKNMQYREKNWRRKCAGARSTLPQEWLAQPGVPLPYGCLTNADVFTDVNNDLQGSLNRNSTIRVSP